MILLHCMSDSYRVIILKHVNTLNQHRDKIRGDWHRIIYSCRYDAFLIITGVCLLTWRLMIRSQIWLQCRKQVY